MDADLDTLTTALYVTIDELLKRAPELTPWRPRVGIQPRLSDAELVTLAVLQALLGFVSEARWLRHARGHLGHLFPYLPGSARPVGLQQAAAPGRRAGAPRHPGAGLRHRAVDRRRVVWVADSTPVECGRSRRPPSVRRWPVGRSTAQVLVDLLAVEPELVAERPGQALIADKNYFGADFERILAGLGVRLLRPARKGEPQRAGAALFRPLRQLIESVNQTFKGQLDLERHGGRTPVGVAVPGAAAHPRLDRRDLAQRQDRPGDPAVAGRL